MQTLKQVARAHRFAVMQPGQIARHFAEQDADTRAFDAAVAWASKARRYRTAKRNGTSCHGHGLLDAMAQEAEAGVREIAKESEFILQCRAEAAQADRAMLRIMLGVAS